MYVQVSVIDKYDCVQKKKKSSTVSEMNYMALGDIVVMKIVHFTI